MKKNLLSILVSVATIITISSCGSNTTSNENSEKEISVSEKTDSVDFVVPEGGFDSTKDVTIKFYTTMGDTLQKVFNAYLEDFNALYPKIHVDTQFIGGYDDVRDQMSTEIAAGQSEVNLAYCYLLH